MAIFEDISGQVADRKSINEHRARIRARIRSIVEALPDLLVCVDRQYRITYLNHSLPGTPLSQEGVGPGLFENLPPDYHETLRAALAQVFATGEIEAGKMYLEIIDFDLRLTLETLTELAAVKAEERGLELYCVIDPDVPTLLRGDPGRLRQVIKLGSTGLGLSISRHLVEAMNGEIGAVSDKGAGATFWFSVVLEQQPPASAELEEHMAQLDGVKILVVGSYATSREILTNLLRCWGCRVVEVPDPMSAVAALQTGVTTGDPCNLAILDHHLTQLSAKALARMIKTDEEISATLLMMLTQNGQKGDARQLEEVGFAGYLTKPVRKGQLHDCLAIALGRQQQPTESKRGGMVTRYTVAEDRRRKIRLLVAEDNPTNQMVARAILKKLGYRVDCVSNGQEAIEALVETTYDLVLMDVQMPVMDGYTATAQIRDPASRVRRHDIPLVAMTAHAMKGDREKCLAAGMDDYLSKPLEAAKLAGALEKWLKKIYLEDEAGAEPETTAEIFDGELTLIRPISFDA